MKLLFQRSLERLQASYWVIPTFMAVVGMLLVPAQYLVHSLLPDAVKRPSMRYEDALDAAFRQIRAYGRADQEVIAQLLRRLLELHDLPVSDDFRLAIVEQLRKLGEQIARGDAAAPESERHLERLRQVLQAGSR